MQKHTQAVYLPANQYTHFNLQPVCLPQASDGKTNKNFSHYYFQHVIKTILAENYL